MRVIIILLISLIGPQELTADYACAQQKPKQSHHQKIAKVTHHVQRSKNIETKGRYVLVTYYKDGKLKHKYFDTKPQLDLQGDNVSREPSASIEQKLDSKVESSN